MKNILRFALVTVLLLTAGDWLFCGQSRPKEITILYDNRPSDPACATDWGFSCFIEGFEKTILLDVGAKEDVFLKNVGALKVDLKTVDVVIISHFLPDHANAIGAFLNFSSGVPVYVPDDQGCLWGEFY